MYTRHKSHPHLQGHPWDHHHWLRLLGYHPLEVREEVVVELVSDMYLWHLLWYNPHIHQSHLPSFISTICFIKVATLSPWCIHTSPFISTQDYHTIYPYPCWAIYIIRLTFLPSCYIYIDFFTATSTPAIYIIGCPLPITEFIASPPITEFIAPPPIIESIAPLPFLEWTTHAARLHVRLPRGRQTPCVRQVLHPSIPSNSTTHVDGVS